MVEGVMYNVQRPALSFSFRKKVQPRSIQEWKSTNYNESECKGRVASMEPMSGWRGDPCYPHSKKDKKGTPITKIT